MTKSPAKVEIEPGAWERFEKAVDGALRTAPIHREKPKAKAESKRTKPKPKKKP